MRRLVSVAIFAVCATLLAACSGGQQEQPPDTTISAPEALKLVVQAAEPECKAQNDLTRPATTTTSTTRTPLPGGTTATTVATTTTTAPVDPVQAYVRFATQVGVRATKFQDLIDQNPDFEAQLQPIAAAYSQANTLATESMLPTARSGDEDHELAGFIDQVEVQLGTARTLGTGLGFKECVAPIAIPKPLG